MAHYRSAELDAALERDDLDGAIAVLRRDVPAIPLFEARVFAAVDARFCGGIPASATSWFWLSDLYPCAEGDSR
jgi:hypothetical protein